MKRMRGSSSASRLSDPSWRRQPPPAVKARFAACEGRKDGTVEVGGARDTPGRVGSRTSSTTEHRFQDLAGFREERFGRRDDPMRFDLEFAEVRLGSKLLQDRWIPRQVCWCQSIESFDDVAKRHVDREMTDGST